jgi:hypothetical protein
MNLNRTPFGRVPTEKPIATPSARPFSKRPTGNKKDTTGNKKDQAKLKSADLSSAQMPAEMSKKRHSDDQGATQGGHKHRRGTSGEFKNRDLMETSKAAASGSTYETEASGRATKSKAPTGHQAHLHSSSLFPPLSVRGSTHQYSDERQRQSSPIKGGSQSLYVSQAHRLDPPLTLLRPSSPGPEVELLGVEQTPPTSSNPSSDDGPIDRDGMDQDEEFCTLEMDVLSDDDIKSDDMVRIPVV